jgi:hypothetical protein
VEETKNDAPVQQAPKSQRNQIAVNYARKVPLMEPDFNDQAKQELREDYRLAVAQSNVITRAQKKRDGKMTEMNAALDEPEKKTKQKKKSTQKELAPKNLLTNLHGEEDRPPQSNNLDKYIKLRQSGGEPQLQPSSAQEAVGG